ncbi:hypothetical protein KY330_05335 [Candidatus Woesearchaeota archaeon]|nr:hypothetical protein [Candidatus Woesearchaeota archaeon]
MERFEGKFNNLVEKLREECERKCKEIEDSQESIDSIRFNTYSKKKGPANYYRSLGRF